MATGKKITPAHVAQPSIFDNERLCFALLCVIVTIAYFFISTDTPMHDMLVARYKHQRHDSAWFYDCGRAWMNGYVPYVDFADSKGPLLWLLYGLAYLVSPHNFFGVYIINTICYCITACFAFKTIRIFTDANKPAFWMAAAMLIIYFTPVIMYDDKSEDIALTFVTIILYLACRMVFDGKNSEPETRRAFFYGGLCFGAIALMKWSICFMTGMMFIYMLIEVLRHNPTWKAALTHIGLAALGVVITFAPFCIYLAAKGAFVAFFDEYFYQTTLTIINLNDANHGHATLKRADIWTYIILLLSGSLLFPLWHKKDWDFPIVVTACMLICTGTFARTYYYIPLHSMMIFTLLAVYKGGKNATAALDKSEPQSTVFNKMLSAVYNPKVARWALIIIPVVAAAAFAIANKKWYNHEYLYDRSSTHERRCAHMCARIIAEKHNAKLLCYNIGNHGYGIYSEALPACKYFGIQGGATPRMKEDQDNCVEQRLADFIVMDSNDTTRQQKAKDNGYEQCTNFKKWRHVIFRKIEQ